MERKVIEFVPKPERVKNDLERLKGLVADISARLNLEVEKEHGIKGLVNPDGTVSMEGFSKANSGIYEPEAVQEDLEEDVMSEISSSLAYRYPAGSAEQKAAVKEWKEARDRSRATQIEMAVMVLFHKILKDEFLVVRSATHDDYSAGVDSLLVNKKTGDVICAIDDVHEGDHDRKKAEKTQRIALKGGARVEYGITVQDGRLKRAKLENVPVFYLGLTTEQLKGLLSSMGDNAESAPSGSEKSLFLDLVSSLEKQKDDLNSLSLKPGIKTNLSRLDAPLLRLREIAQEQTGPVSEKLPRAA